MWLGYGWLTCGWLGYASIVAKVVDGSIVDG